ncbi:hypothetical protein KPH14_001731 [Odynerus spinipes]|uniref:Rhythmically expressed gene 5 protein n=1 Tax=Odynerus spinipes TaxID=1348599 RepID=A0AAD9RZM2_9HYME|nr:hypothetical protein KPH14_001731 [Odynerus spinipes]
MKNPTIIITVLLLSFLTMRVIGSAIPMWEFLSREEKMSRLYRVFTQQVTQFCADSSRPDCNKNLLITGIRNLVNMDDNVLDKLDPYQRGAKEMIWRALMGTSRFSSRTGQEIGGTYFSTIGNGDSETNSITEESESTKDYLQVGPYFIGPMVTRVYPDGRPVLEDRNKVQPRDEDIDEFKYTILPSVADIEASFDKSARRNKVTDYDRKEDSLGGNEPRRRKESTNDSSRYIRLRRISINNRNVGYH